MNGLAVFVGGGLGALCRYGVALGARRAWPAAVFPWGTFVVNVTGCFLLGLLGAVFAARAGLPEPARLGATTGFLGGLTTFSTFGHESVGLLTGGAPAVGVANLVANVAVGLCAAGAGLWLGGRLA